MDQTLTIFRTGAQVSPVFQGANLPTQRLDDGIGAGFARITYKGSKWGMKYQGVTSGIPYRMPDGTVINSPFLDIVILRASKHPNKAWYGDGPYIEGDVGPPDCWSSNGVKPDEAAPHKQSPTCPGCPHNVWGSKINQETGQATRGKACQDMKRLAVVPVGDIENKAYGGPMMLSVPPSSLRRLGPYQNMLDANGLNYCQVWTRVTFDQQSAFPLFSFDAMAALNDAQATQVLKMIDHPLIGRILDDEMKAVEAWDESAQSVHQQIAAEPIAKAAPMPPPPATSPTAASTPAAPSPQPVTAVPQDDLKPPEFLRREPTQPQPSDNPPLASQMVQPPQPQGSPAAPATVTLPPGIVLPPGMDPEQAAQLLAQFQPQQRRGRGRPRTPPVSPTPMDTSQLQGSPLPQPAGLPQQAAPVPITPSTPTTSAAPAPATPDAAVQQIMGTINKLL